MKGCWRVGYGTSQYTQDPYLSHHITNIDNSYTTTLSIITHIATCITPVTTHTTANLRQPDTIHEQQHFHNPQMAETMRAWQFRPSSGPMESNLTLSSVPLPPIKDTEVLVENYSTGLNPIDYKILSLPLIPRLLFSHSTPGLEVCGRVASIGSFVTDFKVGDIVYGAKPPGDKHGSLAQYVPISEKLIARVPKSLEDRPDDMVAIATVGMTVHAALAPYAKPENRVFINGGSGGAGVAAIQIAKILGYHVTVSTSTANIALCKGLGANEVLDYTTAPIIQQLKDGGKLFDLVLDNVGAPANLYRVCTPFLKPEGKFIQVGLGLNIAGVWQLATNNVLSALSWGKRQYIFVDAKADRAIFEQLAAWMEEGKLRVVIDSTFDFGAAPKAYEKLKLGRARGKIVVHIKAE
jgi:NADPH:quinone reductase-like Zn-dependent oxidoreductase